MPVAVVSEIISGSTTGWDDAARRGMERARKTLRNITGFEVVSQKAKVVDGEIREFRVALKVTFILDDTVEGGKKKK